jgi:hypothetical protein
MWVRLLSLADAGGTLGRLLGLAGPEPLLAPPCADALFDRVAVLASCPHCKRSEVPNAVPGPDPQPAFVYACDALAERFDTRVMYPLSDGKHWMQLSYMINRHINNLIVDVYLPVRDRCGLEHRATREAAAFIERGVAKRKGELAAQGRLERFPCVYCTSGAALKQAEQRAQEVFLEPNFYGFHCADAAHVG